MVKILNLLPNKFSLFETVIVSANDTLVELFLKKAIRFTDIQKKLFELSNEESLFEKSQKIVDNFLKSKNKPHEKIDDIKFFLGFSSNSKKQSNVHINILVENNGKVLLKN